MSISWLIECGENPVLYFSNDGDWCNNPNHAHKFPSAKEATQKMVTLAVTREPYRVVEHAWQPLQEPKHRTAAQSED